MSYSKLLTFIVLLLTITSIGIVYKQYLVKEDFIVKYRIPCEQARDRCFIHECDEALEECTGNAEEDTSYYTIMYRLAKNIPSCDDEENCSDSMMCNESEKSCSKVFCDDATSLTEGAECSNPEDFSNSQADTSDSAEQQLDSEKASAQ